MLSWRRDKSGGNDSGDASRKAKLFCWLGFGLGLAAQLIVGLFYGLAIAAAASNSGGY